MRHGVRIGTVFGIELRVDWSLAVVFVLLAWGLATVSLPSLVERYNNAEYWAVAIGATALFFVSLLAHELSHSVVARRRGIGVRDITLWLFGGVSTLEAEARTPRGDFAIAIAGPATSIVIGVGGALLGLALFAIGAPPLAIAAVGWLSAINLVLAVFNLIPAAPLDGGRVLRAWLWQRNGDHDAASLQAARAGHVFGWGLIGLGLLEFMGGGDLGGIWLIFLGWFLLGASRNEEMQVTVQHALHDVRVRDVMTSSPITAPADASIAEILDHYVLAHPCSAFPLIDDAGRLVGLLTLAHCKAVPQVARPTTRARDVATPLPQVPTALADELLLPVLQRAPEDDDGRILVMDRSAHLVGIVTPTDVRRAVQFPPGPAPAQ